MRQRDKSFAVLDASTLCVRDQSARLWLEHAPFGTVPPKREQVDANVAGFSAVDAETIYVLRCDGNLWLEHAPFATVAPQHVDNGVSNCAALDAATVYVLDTDGTLWLEQAPFGTTPRQQVDTNVFDYAAIDAATVYVLGTDGNLWLEHGPFGAGPSHREQVDAHVATFHPVDAGSAYVVGTDGNLWLEHAPFGTVPPLQRGLMAANMLDCAALDLSIVYLLDTERNLSLIRGPVRTLPPPRQQVDSNVIWFSPVDAFRVCVLDGGGNLWLDDLSAGAPPHRTQIDANVYLMTSPTYPGVYDVREFGASGNARYFNTGDGTWYQDADYTLEASDDAPAFRAAMAFVGPSAGAASTSRPGTGTSKQSPDPATSSCCRNPTSPCLATATPAPYASPPG